MSAIHEVSSVEQKDEDANTTRVGNISPTGSKKSQPIPDLEESVRQTMHDMLKEKS